MDNNNKKKTDNDNNKKDHHNNKNEEDNNEDINSNSKNKLDTDVIENHSSVADIFNPTVSSKTRDLPTIDGDANEEDSITIDEEKEEQSQQNEEDSSSHENKNLPENNNNNNNNMKTKKENVETDDEVRIVVDTNDVNFLADEKITDNNDDEELEKDDDDNELENEDDIVESMDPISYEEIDMALKLKNKVPNLYNIVKSKIIDSINEGKVIEGKQIDETKRILKFDFVESGVAYHEDVESTVRVQSIIPLDVIRKPDICEFVRVPRTYEGINYIGYYNVEFRYIEDEKKHITNNVDDEEDDNHDGNDDSDEDDKDGDDDDDDNIVDKKGQEKTCDSCKRYQILIPGERTYDPAGIENDVHCGLAIGNACSMTQTAILTTMIKALKEGATYDSIRNMHLEHLNPLISKYHGRIPLSMWMLHQLKCIFAKDVNKKRQPFTYAHFLLNALKRHQRRYKPSVSIDITDEVSMQDGDGLSTEEIRKNLENLEKKNGIDDEDDDEDNVDILIDLKECEYDLTGKFLCPYIEWDDVKNDLIVLDDGKKMLHLRKYLMSYLHGNAVPPVEYFETLYKKMRKLIEYKDVVKKEKKRLMKKEKLEEDGSVASNKEEKRQRKHSSGGILSAVVGFFSTNEPVNKPGIGISQPQVERKVVKVSSGFIKNKQRRGKTFLKKQTDEMLKKDPLLPYLRNKDLIPLARTMGHHFIQVCNDTNISDSTEHARKIMEHWALELDPYKLATKATEFSKKSKSGRIGWRYIDIPIFTNVPNDHVFAPKGVQSRVFGPQMMNALIYAIIKRKKKIIETILTQTFRDRHGFLVKIASPNCRDANGWTPLMHAAVWGDIDVVDWLLDYKQGWMEHEIGTLNDPIQDNAVLLQDVETSLQSYDGITALMLACYNGHRDVVERLINYDSSLLRVFGRIHLRKLGFNKGATVAHIVCGMRDQHVEILQLLLRTTKYVGTKDDTGNTPLHYAAKLGHVNMIEALIEMDAAVTAMNNLGQTPLMLAAKSSCSLSSVTVLLKWGARVNNSDYNGKSSLHYAFEAYKEIMVLQRMVHGADLFAKFWRNSISLRKLSHGKKASAVGNSMETPEKKKTMMKKHVTGQLLYKDGGGQILIYTQDNCNFCTKVRKKFKDKGIPFYEVNVSQHPLRQSSMLSNSTPEIWFNDTLVGGLSDLEAIEIEGKLESLLRACLAEPPSPSAPVPVKVNKKIVAAREKVYKLQSLISSLDINVNIETFERKSALQDGIIHLLLSKDADLDALSNAGKEPFDDELKVLWLAKVRSQLLESSDRSDGWNDQCWRYKRTQKAVHMEWENVAKGQSMIKSLMWLMLCLALFLATFERFGFSNTNARLLHDGLVARFLGKPYDFSEQPNKRYMDTDTRQDFYNFFHGAFIPGLFDSDRFWSRDKASSTTSDEGVTVPSNGHIPCVRHLKLVGVPRLRQLRVKCIECSKNTIKGTYPKVLVNNTNGNADNCCYPPFSESTEDKESFQGTFSKKIYTWSKANFVPYSHGSENLHQYHGGGYIVLVPTNATGAYILNKELQNDNWIDLNTRAVITEFVVINEEEKLLGSVTLVLEFFSAGSIKPSYIVRVWRQSFDEVVPIISAGVFVLLYFYFLFYLFTREYCKKWRDKHEKAFICDFGHSIGERKEYYYYQTKTKKKLFGWRPTGAYGGGFYGIPVTEESKWQVEKADDKTRISLFSHSFRVPRFIYMLGTSLRKCIKSICMIILTIIIIERINIEVKLSTLISEQQLGNSNLDNIFPEKHVDLNYHTSFYTKLVSISMVFCALRLLSLFDWLPSVARMSMIIFQQLDKLRYFLLIFLIFLVMYGSFGLFSIGVEVGEEFGTISKSMVAMYGGITTQGFQFLTMERAAPVISPIIFVFVLTTGVILILNLLIAFMTEGYQAVIDLASETWAYSQFQQIVQKQKEAAEYELQRKSAAAALKAKESEEAGKGPQAITPRNNSNTEESDAKDTQYSNKISAAAFKQDMNLCELARRAGEPYRVSSQIGKLLMLWYSGTRRNRRRRRYYRQKRRGKRLVVKGVKK